MDIAKFGAVDSLGEMRHSRVAFPRHEPYESVRDVLSSSSHRPWPIPRGPWVMSQLWHDLAFFHWPVDCAALRPHVPPPLEIDLFENQAWLAIVPFWMSRIRLRGLPPLPFISHFAELNVRTYVRHRGRSGVLFLTLDAPIAAMNAIARRWYHLPYRRAQMSVRRCNGNGISFESHRTERGDSAEFVADYAPIASVHYSRTQTLEHWLTERYCLFAPTPAGRVVTAEIHHSLWPLQRAQATIHVNTMTRGLNLPLPSVPPMVHFSADIRALIWMPHSCE